MHVFGLSHLILTSTLKRRCSFLHFTNEETKAGRAIDSVNDRARIQIWDVPSQSQPWRKVPEGASRSRLGFKRPCQHHHSFNMNSDQGEKPDTKTKVSAWRGLVEEVGRARV